MHFYAMDKLNFPDYKFQFKSNENKTFVFDPLRKKWMVLTPEEWVRLHCVQFLIQEKQYPASFIAVEKQITIFNTVKRFDVVIYQSNQDVSVLVECKAPREQITQKVFDQIARYNLKLKSNYLMVTNGMFHYFCQMDYDNQKYTFIKSLPPFKSVKND